MVSTHSHILLTELDLTSHVLRFSARMPDWTVWLTGPTAAAMSLAGDAACFQLAGAGFALCHCVDGVQKCKPPSPSELTPHCPASLPLPRSRRLRFPCLQAAPEKPPCLTGKPLPALLTLPQRRRLRIQRQGECVLCLQGGLRRLHRERLQLVPGRLGLGGHHPEGVHQGKRIGVVV